VTVGDDNAVIELFRSGVQFEPWTAGSPLIPKVPPASGHHDADLPDGGLGRALSVGS
jgi:hypothetical protein